MAAEITYGLERIAMYLQDVESVFDLKWNEKVTYGELYLNNEVEQSTYNFQESDPELLVTLFGLYRQEARRLLDKKLIMPAYEQVLKCSHTFNLLDARGALGRDERMANILRIRRLSEPVARGYLEQRIKMGFPLWPEAGKTEIVEAYRERYLAAKQQASPAHAPGCRRELDSWQEP